MLFIDIETFSSVDLKKAGVYAYAESLDFEILMAAWSADHGATVNLAVGEGEISRIPGLFDPQVTKVAHNAAFERVCLSLLAAPEALGPEGYLPPEQWVDTQLLAAEAGLPQSLDKLAKAVGADEKDSAGTRLVNLFCRPQRGRRVFPGEKPDQWSEFKAYCVQDVVTLVDVFNRLPARHLPTTLEQQVWLVHETVNDRGIRIDRELAQAAVLAGEANHAAHRAEVTDLTGVDNPGSVQQIQTWLQGTGLDLPDLRAATVTDALAGSLTPSQRRVLELRQELALSSSKKFEAALTGVCDDDRLRGQFRFFGAHTGRWSGRGVQLQNLARAAFEKESPNGETVWDEAGERRAMENLKSGRGADSVSLKKMVRPLFVGPFTVVDYSAIEARVLAWLAGEEWVLEAFRDGRDIYSETAKRTGGLTRFEGKVMTLALGYQGGVGSLRVMGGEALGTDAQLQRLVDLWRGANPNVVRFWSRLDAAFRRTGKVGHLSVEKTEDRQGRKIILPSGRAIHYHKVGFHTLTRAGHKKKAPPSDRWARPSFADPRGIRVDTYGGKLAENVTQAVARDVLAEALTALHRQGHRVVGHIHDEVLVEGTDLSSVSEIMRQVPPWAEGLPIDVDGAVTERYRKM